VFLGSIFNKIILILWIYILILTNRLHCWPCSLSLCSANQTTRTKSTTMETMGVSWTNGMALLMYILSLSIKFQI
jgi:hypothetical protein